VFAAAVLTGFARADDADRVNDYVKALRDNDAAVRRQAAGALGELGAKAKAAVPALRAAIIDGDAGVRSAAALALEKINPPARVADPAKELAELRARHEAAMAEVRQLAESLATARQAVQERERQVQLLEAKARDAEATLKKFAEQVKQVRDKDAVAIQERFQEIVKKVDELTRERESLRDRLTGAEIQARALEARNADLQARLAETQRQLALLRAGATDPPVKAPPRGNPPAANVEGMVKQVQADTGLMTISIGSDAGLEKGHTLEIFRLAPKPQHLGIVVVVDVNPREAVCKPVGKPAEPIKQGDRVASRILPK
jgi:hypothetical protein